MMTKNITLFLGLVMMFGVSFAQSAQEKETAIAWEEVQVVYDLNEVTEMTRGKKMTETIKTSLNFASKAKIKRNCLKELKKQAAEEGYSVIYLDEKAYKDRRFNKRDIEVTLVGIGYKG